MALGKKSFSIDQTRSSVSIASQWAHSVDTGKRFNNVLLDFQKLVRAETVQMVRQMRNFDRTRVIARQVETEGQLYVRPTRSFASAMLGELLHKTDCGTFTSIKSVLSDSETRDFLEPLGLLEVGLISLSNENDCSDFLEFHFDSRIPDHNRLLLQMLGPILSKSWRDRAPGVVSALLTKSSFPTGHESKNTVVNILGESNPTELTRSEFRICMMVQEGGLPGKIAEALNISKSTFRSHLRSIYCKTGVSGQVELIHLLHQSHFAASSMQVPRSLRG